MYSRFVLAVGLCTASVLVARQNPGAVFLMIWPSARSTALAGAMAAHADDPDAAYWNPGGLGFQKDVGVMLNGTLHGWLPGLWPGMYYSYASGGYGMRAPLGLSGNLNLGGNITYLTTGETDVVNERGEYLGRYRTWDAAFGIHGGLALAKNLGLGAGIKYIHSVLVPEWVWEAMPELGIDAGGTGRSVAFDLGALYKPVRPVSVGLAIANIGPNISYTDTGQGDPLPAMLRFGLCATPIDNAVGRLRLLFEFDKILPGVFENPGGRYDFGQLLSMELRDAWKSFAVEATAAQMLTWRIGYFEDVSGQRGGFVFERASGETSHYGIGDLLTKRNLGKLKSIGLCWGLGGGYKNYFRLDVSSDALIYDFPTANWKLALTVNDLAGMKKELKGRELLDWMP